MQLTTARLKQIIKEELEAITSEMSEEEEEVETELNEGLLNEDMNAAQIMLASVAGLAGAGSLAMIPMLVRDAYRTLTGSDIESDAKDKQKVAQAQQVVKTAAQQKTMQEAKKKAALAKQKMPAKRGGSPKNVYAKAESHKMKPMGSKGK